MLKEWGEGREGGESPGSSGKSSELRDLPVEREERLGGEETQKYAEGAKGAAWTHACAVVSVCMRVLVARTSRRKVLQIDKAGVAGTRVGFDSAAGVASGGGGRSVEQSHGAAVVGCVVRGHLVVEGVRAENAHPVASWTRKNRKG